MVEILSYRKRNGGRRDETPGVTRRVPSSWSGGTKDSPDLRHGSSLPFSFLLASLPLSSPTLRQVNVVTTSRIMPL